MLSTLLCSSLSKIFFISVTITIFYTINFILCSFFSRGQFSVTRNVSFENKVWDFWNLKILKNFEIWNSKMWTFSDFVLVYKWSIFGSSSATRATRVQHKYNMSDTSATRMRQIKRLPHELKELILIMTQVNTYFLFLKDSFYFS